MNKLIDLGTQAIRAKDIKSVSKTWSFADFPRKSERVYKVLINLYMGKQIQLEYYTEEKRDAKYNEIVLIANECSSDE